MVLLRSGFGSLGRVVILVAAFICDPSLAQGVRGYIFDDLTELPVNGATITLIREGDRAVQQAVTDFRGEFAIAAIPGTYALYVSRFDYRHFGVGPFEVRDDTLRYDIFVEREPVELGGVEVEAERLDRRLADVGFYRRKMAGFGQYRILSPEDKGMFRLPSDVFKNMRGIVLRPDPDGLGRPLIMSSRQQNRLDRRLCLMTVVVDGQIVMRHNELGKRLEDFVIVERIDAVEVYLSAAGLPAEYAGMNAPCGAILIWSGQ